MPRKNNLPPHLAHQTKFSRTGELDVTNRKPWRTAAQKKVAKDQAEVVDGRWVSPNAPRNYHRSR